MANHDSHFLSAMFKESDAYSSMELIESYVEKGVSLKNVPLQPLYLALKSLPLDQVVKYLEKLSPEQRALMQDLDLWTKDELDPEEFDFWVQAYASCLNDDVRSEFSCGVEFLLYLKGRFNIWTFDAEDPNYPDHDNYFLTDDGLLLFEFHEDFSLVSEVRTIIREIYSTLGVEDAYCWLFKMVSEGAISMVEDEYQFKNGRLTDAGFVDYFSALEIDNPHINRQVMENNLIKKEQISVGVHQFSKQQVLPKNALLPFKGEFSSFDDELLKVEDEKRKEYLRFNFLRLVNGNVAIKGSYKDGAIAITRAGEKTKNLLLLGFDYLNNEFRKKNQLNIEAEESLFNLYDFTEIYRVGNSLIRFLQKDLKKALRSSGVSEEERFLGPLINEYLDNLFSEPVLYAENFGSASKTVISYEIYELLERDCKLYCQLIPFIGELYKNFIPLRVEGRIQDHFYLNYSVEEIDAEAIFLSSFANHVLVGAGKLEEEVVNKGKLGLTVEEFRSFTKALLGNEGEVDLSKGKSYLETFWESFGLSKVPFIDLYFEGLLKSQLEGYDYQELIDGDFAHVGGPIIFKPAKDLS